MGSFCSYQLTTPPHRGVECIEVLEVSEGEFPRFEQKLTSNHLETEMSEVMWCDPLTIAGMYARVRVATCAVISCRILPCTL